MDVGALVVAAAGGDPSAWKQLVDRYNSLLWSIARSFRLTSADASDVVQTTWLKLVENLGRITEPDRIPAWLATTARRECLQLLRRSGRAQLSHDWEMVLDVVDPAPLADELVVRQERDHALWNALARLSERCQQLLRVLMASPPPAYTEVSAALEMPIGSIGPTRARCLGQLRDIARADEVLQAEQPKGGQG